MRRWRTFAVTCACWLTPRAPKLTCKVVLLFLFCFEEGFATTCPPPPKNIPCNYRAAHELIAPRELTNPRDPQGEERNGWREEEAHVPCFFFFFLNVSLGRFSSFLSAGSLSLSPSLSVCLPKYSWFETEPAAPEFKKSALTTSSRLTLRWVSAPVELWDMCCC